VLSADVAGALLRGYDGVNARVSQMPATFDKVRNRAVVTFQEIIGGTEKSTGGFAKFYGKVDDLISIISRNKGSIIAFLTSTYNMVTGIAGALTTVASTMEKIIGFTSGLANSFGAFLSASDQFIGSLGGVSLGPESFGSNPAKPTASNVSNSSKVVNNRVTINQTNNNQLTGSSAAVAASTRRQTEAAVKSAYSAFVNVS
jgi:hypothetical protein